MKPATPAVSTKAEAIVLLSGGLDSATALYSALKSGYRVTALSFDYSQRHRVELLFAAQLAKKTDSRHLILKLDSQIFSGSALTDLSIPVPQNRAIDESIPVTYVPARNILFLSHALALCESIKAYDIFIGANILDYSGYPDCRPDFFSAFEKVAELGTKAGVEGKKIRIQAPLIKLTKAEIIRLGMELGVDYSITSSCYQPSSDGKPCMTCDSCILRAKGFAEAGLKDPLVFH